MTQTDNAPYRTDFAAARKAMVDSQLRTSGVNDMAVIGRMATLPREDFLPANAAPIAYQDRAIALADGGAMAAPLYYGKLLVEAQPGPQDNVLVVDGGSGYLAALVEPMVASVSALPAAEAAAMTKAPKAEQGAYSLLLIDGAVEAIPAALAQCLAEGGRLAGGLAEGSVTRLAVGRASGGKLDLLPVADLGIPHLSAFDTPKRWTF